MRTSSEASVFLGAVKDLIVSAETFDCSPVEEAVKSCKISVIVFSFGGVNEDFSVCFLETKK